MQRRDKNGKFMKEKDVIDNIFLILKLIFQILPFFLFFIYVINYVNGWKFFSDAFYHIRYMGSKECSFVCNFAGDQNDRINDGL